MSAIFMLENLEDSLLQFTSLDENESEGVTEFTPSLGDAINFVVNSFAPKDNLVDTKKEIIDFFLSNYIREFYDPSKQIDTSFFDFKMQEKLKENFDLKNISLNFSTAPTLSQQLRLLDTIGLDENQKPLVNKFLSTFMGEE